MKFTVVLALLLTALCLSSLGHGEEGAARVMPLLKGYEWQFDAEEFRALPANSYQELLRIARDRNHPGFIRERAMAALRLYANDEVWSFFDDEVRNGADKINRRRAVEAMCQAFAQQHPQRVEGAIAHLLDDEDPHLRVIVARCLRTLNSESATQRFGSYRSKISESWEAEAVDAPRTQ